MPKESNKLSVKHVAARLGVTDRTIRRYIERGEFPNAKPEFDYPTAPIGIPEDDVIAYEKRKAKANAALP